MAIKTILIAEDETEEMKRYVKHICDYNDNEFKVLPCFDGEQVMEVLYEGKHKFAGFLLDMCLPDASGYQLFQNIRIQQYYQPVLLHSSSPMPGIEKLIEALHIGNNCEVCSKTQDLDYITRWIERL